MGEAREIVVRRPCALVPLPDFRRQIVVRRRRVGPLGVPAGRRGLAQLRHGTKCGPLAEGYVRVPYVLERRSPVGGLVKPHRLLRVAPGRQWARIQLPLIGGELMLFGGWRARRIRSSPWGRTGRSSPPGFLGSPGSTCCRKARFGQVVWVSTPVIAVSWLARRGGGSAFGGGVGRGRPVCGGWRVRKSFGREGGGAVVRRGAWVRKIGGVGVVGDVSLAGQMTRRGVDGGP